MYWKLRKNYEIQMKTILENSKIEPIPSSGDFNKQSASINGKSSDLFVRKWLFYKSGLPGDGSGDYYGQCVEKINSMEKSIQAMIGKLEGRAKKNKPKPRTPNK